MISEGFGFIIGSLAWGCLLGGVLILLFTWLTGLWQPGTTLLSWGVAAIAGVLLIIQSTLLCGAIKLHSSLSDLEPALTEMTLRAEQMAQESGSELKNSMESYTESIHPALSMIMDKYEIPENLAISEYPSYFIGNWKSGLRWYMARRAGWMALFLLLSAFAIIRLQRPVFSSATYGTDRDDSYIPSDRY